MSQDKDPLDELAEAVEKAKGKGLIRGGSKKLQRRMQGRAYGMASWGDGRRGSNRANRAHRANEYLATRTGRNMFGATPPRLTPRGKWRVHKSIEALDAEIEKAKGLMPKGGTSRMHGKTLAALIRRNPTKALSRGPIKLRGKQNRTLARVESYLVDRAVGIRRRRGQRFMRQGLYKSADVHKAKAKTLYVYRPVENAADIIAWAESQGFKSTQPAEKLHVTLAYSKTPLNWAMLHDDYHLEPSDFARSCGCEVVSRSDDNSKRRKISGGVREVKALGSDGAVVLAFESDSLTNRWMDFKRAGAAWKFPSFTPHITFTYDGESVDLSKVLPYVGDIILGEECWEEVSEDGQAKAIAAEKQVKKSLTDIEARVAALEAKKEAA